MSASLTIVVGTTGRPSLERTLQSIVSQRLPGDETIIVSANQHVLTLAQRYGCRFIAIDTPGNDWGDTERQRGLDNATCDYVCFLDDDDIHVPGARQMIAEAIEWHPNQPLMFRMRFDDGNHPLAGQVLFLDPVVKLGNVGTPMIVLPNDKTKVGKWGCRGTVRGGDFDFISSMKWSEDQLVWIRQVLAIVTPEGTAVPVKPLTRPLRVLLVHPGATWSTADVEAGLRYGLEKHGVDVIRYRLDARIERAGSWLHFAYRKAKKTNPEIVKPTKADVLYQASSDVLATALRHQVDCVLVVSAMCLHPDIIILMKRAGLRIAVLFTETPYDIEQEIKIAKMVDGCWTNERTAVEAFRTVNENCTYLPHAWHPERHYVGGRSIDDAIPSHDVVFVGSGFSERVAWFNAIDWTGIDLGLYGTWKGFGLNPQLAKYVRGNQVDNRTAAALYRRAKIGLNLYRRSKGFGRRAPLIERADSLSPRAYELAACGAFHISDDRAEVREVFGDLVPTFRTPNEAADLIRHWLADDAGRARVASQLPACVAESSWVHRATHVIGDVQSLIQQSTVAA